MQSRIERFVEHLSQENYAANTVIAYRADLAQLLEYLEQGDNTAWRQVREEDIINYLLHLREREYASSTVTRKMAAVSSFFRYLMLEGVISNDPISNISLSHAARPSSGDVLSEGEVERLLAHIAQDHSPKGLRDQVLVGLMVQAGFRPSELAALGLEDVEGLSGRLPALAIRWGGFPGCASLRAALKRYVREGRPHLDPSDEESALFLSMEVGAGGGRLTRQGVWLIVRDRAGACGLEKGVSPRLLRRTYLTHRQHR